MTTKRIMVDIETLSLEPTAYVWEVAFVDMDNPLWRVHAYLSSNLFTNPAMARGFHVDQKTIDWSLQHGSPRFKQWMEGRCTESTVLEISNQLSERLNHTNNTIWWARNSAFDFPILEHMFKTFHRPVPWYHRNKRCLYTHEHVVRQLANATGTPLGGEPEQENKHSAIDDAMHQIRVHDMYEQAALTMVGASK